MNHFLCQIDGIIPIFATPIFEDQTLGGVTVRPWADHGVRNISGGSPHLGFSAFPEHDVLAVLAKRRWKIGH